MLYIISKKFELNQSSKMINLIESYNPDIVINTAAYPSVDFCETHPEMADKLHVGITKEIANICSKKNSKLFYIYTDRVFDEL